MFTYDRNFTRMKSLFALFLCFLTLGIGLTQDYPEGEIDLDNNLGFSLNDQIKTALENLKKQMPCGFPDHGIPPLAPFKRTYTEIKHEHSLYSILLNLFDLRVDGLNDYRINDVALSVLTMKGTFDLNFNKVIANGDYKMNFFPINLIRIHGEGKLNFQLKDLRVKGDFQLGIKGTGLTLRSFNIAVVLGDCNSDISGLLGGGFTGRLANRSIEKFVKFFIKTQSRYISDTIREKIVPIVNEKLQQYTIKDILDMISAGQKPPTCVPPPDDTVKLLLQLIELTDLN